MGGVRVGAEARKGPFPLQIILDLGQSPSMPRREILSPEQRIDLFALPRDEGELIRLYTLSQHDLAQVRRNRGEHNRLGFAVLLCHLRYPGQELWANMEPDPRLIALMAKQIGVNPGAWARYAKREPTRREHMLRLMKVYGYQSFTTAHYQNLLEWLHPMAMQTEQGKRHPDRRSAGHARAHPWHRLRPRQTAAPGGVRGIGTGH